jgi:cation transport ATPase
MLKPTVVSVVAIDGRSDDELLALATGAADGHIIIVADARRFAALGLLTDGLGTWAERLRRQGQHVVFVAVDGQTAGLLGVIDAAV